MDALTELSRVCDETYLEWAPPGWTVAAPAARLGRPLPAGRRVGAGGAGRGLALSRSVGRSAQRARPRLAHVGHRVRAPVALARGIAARLMEPRRGRDASRAATSASSCGRPRARRPRRSTLARAGALDGRREWHPWAGLQMVGYARALAVRVLLGAFGDPGHAFPVIALGSELVARGHEVGIETWERWRAPCEDAGMAFSPAPEYQVFPTRERPLKPYEAAVLAARSRRASSCATSRPTSRSRTSSRARPRWRRSSRACRWRRSSRTSTPISRPGFPPFSIGARRPRTRVGRACGGSPIARSRSASSRAAASSTTAAHGSGWRPCRRCTPGSRAT